MSCTVLFSSSNFLLNVLLSSLGSPNYRVDSQRIVQFSQFVSLQWFLICVFRIDSYACSKKMQKKLFVIILLAPILLPVRLFKAQIPTVDLCLVRTSPHVSNSLVMPDQIDYIVIENKCIQYGTFKHQHHLRSH